MAARRHYATPPEQMLHLAREARLNGIAFEDWWDRAVRPGHPPILITTERPWPEGVVIWPSDSADRNHWRAATDDETVKDGWRRAYENLPAAPRESALKILGPLLAGEILSAPLPRHVLAA